MEVNGYKKFACTFLETRNVVIVNLLGRTNLKNHLKSCKLKTKTLDEESRQILETVIFHNAGGYIIDNYVKQYLFNSLSSSRGVYKLRM